MVVTLCVTFLTQVSSFESLASQWHGAAYIHTGPSRQRRNQNMVCTSRPPPGTAESQNCPGLADEVRAQSLDGSCCALFNLFQKSWLTLACVCSKLVWMRKLIHTTVCGTILQCLPHLLQLRQLRCPPGPQLLPPVWRFPGRRLHRQVKLPQVPLHSRSLIARMGILLHQAASIFDISTV